MEGNNGEDDPNNSEAILLKWLTTQGNCARFHGAKNSGGVKKVDISVKIANTIN